ncbi:hypothetical protein H0H92_001173 [Tricholoma furcatifolium]|nr:hypothetical protein H0H92_001173 [Tricholoma furcatifolium]
MELEMSNIPNGAFHPNEQQQTNAPVPEQPSVSANTATETPSKRRPGRPKGSTKKNLTGEPILPPKPKRPVGRPRKDGFPAGSMGTKPRPPKHVASAPHAASWMAGVSYAQHFPLDPNLASSDDWAVLAPNPFLASLLTALNAPNPISTAGPSVEEAFKSHLNSLNPMSNSPIPSLYSILKTFWLPASPAYFSLTASASTARTPSEHRFLYWDPLPLVFNGIACPGCGTPLLNRGRISSGPIKIYDIERPFFIIGCEYLCRSPPCLASSSDGQGRKFASTDASIFRALPAKLKDEFPARLLYADADAGCGPDIWNWAALGVSQSLWNLVRGCLRMGMGKAAILGLVDAVQRGVPEDERGNDPAAGGPSASMVVVPAQQKLPPEGGGGSVEPHNGNGAESAEGSHSQSHSHPEPEGEHGNEQGAGPSAEINHALVQTIIEAYNDAWKANSGSVTAPSSSAGAQVTNASTSAPVAGPGPGPGPAHSSPQPTPSPSHTHTHTPQQQLKSPLPAPLPPPPQQMFDYTKGFAGYPFSAYAFFPGGVVPHPPHPVSAPASASGSGSGSGSGSSSQDHTASTSNSGSPGLKRPFPFDNDSAVGVCANGSGGLDTPQPETLL